MHAPLIIICLAAMAMTIALSVAERRRLARFWRRPCTGPLWRRAFPDASTADVREFLRLFVDAFALPDRRCLSFRPDDRVMDIYRAIYTPGWTIADAMELEILAIRIEQRYGHTVTSSDPESLTLGDIYRQLTAL